MLDRSNGFWLGFWGIIGATIVGFTVTIAVGLNLAQVNATEQMKVCTEAGMSYLTLDGDGTCMK